MDRQTAIIGEGFERFLIFLSERSVALVYHLDDAEDTPLDENGHAQDRARLITDSLIHRPIETWVGISIRNIQSLNDKLSSQSG